MRIHRLEVEAFGPFADRQTVDFDELSGAGLFLLNGETGAGKTSVLDAICYALYGGLPGAREGSTRLRSDHAAESVAPEVLCEFSTGGRRFEVLRSPAWERPKSRGSGTTKQQAQSRLREHVDGSWREKSTRNDEVSGEVRAVLGLDKEQFTKVAMLPQGEFASFLRAKDKEREALLKRLFDTTTYASVEQLLADRLSSARVEADDARRSRVTKLEHLRTEAGATLGSEAEPDALDVGDDRLPQAIADLLELRLAESDGQLRLTELSLFQAQTTVRELEQRVEDARLLGELDERTRRHRGEAAAAGEAAEVLRAHERAVAVQAEAQASAAAEAESLAATKEADRTLAALRAHQMAASLVEDAKSVGEAHRLASDEAAVVAEALPQETELSQLDARVTALGREIVSLEAEVGSDEADLARARESLPGLRADVEATSKEASALDSRRSSLESAERILGLVRERDAHRPRARAAAEKWVRASEDALRARGEATLLSRHRLSQAAASLAVELTEGEPCPVCGSHEHPMPATSGDGPLVTDADEAAAEAAAAVAAATELQVREALDKERIEESRLLALAGSIDETDAAETVRQASGALETARDAADRHCAARERESETLRRVEEFEPRVGAGRQRLAALRSSAEELGATAGAQRKRLANLRGSHASLAARLADVRSAAELLGRRVDAERRLASSSAALVSARAKLDAVLSERGFADAAERVAALQPARREGELRALLAEHGAEAVRLETLAAHPGIARARTAAGEGPGEPTSVALAAAADHRASCAGARDAALRERAVLDSYAGRFGAARTALDELLARMGPVLERFETVKAVAELVRGGGENILRMTLSTYVLAARLEAVAAAATVRLNVMSNGRYALVHDDGRRGNNKSGLGLQVVDAWTGQQRDTSTLSGGESFMASLSLALGLADVVQQESGGIDMETLFVDEGFGSLDEGALELVMDAIDGLRAGGRTVGVVSHVPEMKQRIPAQLRVDKGRHGSRLSVVMDTVGAR
ncbi:AAA family ATPase [Arthrobacter sp. KK5.5]|uniref:AAA family ATPase n=1 Tax=Arthrobacter sp. KK5.5 TaxID=3373084 RepID=UPI003EE50BC4